MERVGWQDVLIQVAAHPIEAFLCLDDAYMAGFARSQRVSFEHTNRSEWSTWADHDSAEQTVANASVVVGLVCFAASSVVLAAFVAYPLLKATLILSNSSAKALLANQASDVRTKLRNSAAYALSRGAQSCLFGLPVILCLIAIALRPMLAHLVSGAACMIAAMLNMQPKLLLGLRFTLCAMDALVLVAMLVASISGADRRAMALIVRLVSSRGAHGAQRHWLNPTNAAQVLALFLPGQHAG